MMLDFFKKKENIFIIIVAVICMFFIAIGFLLLFFSASPSEPRKIPNTVADIVWKPLRSDLLRQEILYPEHLYVSEQREESGVGINVSDIEARGFLNYFTNQNHLSLYPSGLDVPFFYGKTRASDFTSGSGQEYARTEYLTVDGTVWAIKLVPKAFPINWQPQGFIWIQAKVRDMKVLCITDRGVVIDSLSCDPYAGQQPVYTGTVSDSFIRAGYEIINKNSFK